MDVLALQRTVGRPLRRTARPRRFRFAPCKEIRILESGYFCL